MEDGSTAFDELLQSVLARKAFIRRYNFVFNFMLAFVGTMVYMNIILATMTPDHWCYVPRDENENLTSDQWKTLNLPREINSHGQNVTSSCRMYEKNRNNHTRTVTECLYGYEYDTTWFSDTISSSQDWVCDKSIYVTNLLAAMKGSEIIGGLLLGYLGDKFGRRLVYFSSLFLMIVGRTSSLFLTKWYPAFLSMSIIAALPSVMLAQTCMVTLMELSAPDDRATISQIHNLGWSLANCFLPLLYWFVGDWNTYIIVSTVPLWIYVILSIHLIESPQWLISQGRVEDCFKQLNVIAKVNRLDISTEDKKILFDTKLEVEESYGIGSLFYSWDIAKTTITLIFAWISSIMSYNILLVGATSLSGNPFLNFFLQGLAEAPSYLLAKVLCDRYGRCYTAMYGFFANFICSIILILIINNSDVSILPAVLAAIAKAGACISYFVTNLQGLEIYPTCVRQSANSLGLTTGNAFSILGPYIVYLGVSIDARLPYVVLLILSISGIVSEVFLPETRNRRLPRTLQEAKLFGQENS